MQVRQTTIEEAVRAVNSLEVTTVVLSESHGYGMRRLSMVHRPGSILTPITYVVRLKERQHDETDKVVEEGFGTISEAIEFYNKFNG